MALISISSVLAANYEVHKYTTVDGDWLWDGTQWTQPSPEPVTATYQMDAMSGAVAGNWYQETEQLGQPWKYKLDTHVFMGGAGTIDNHFYAWTVNDPITTPATGGYTQYSFTANNYGQNTESHLTVTGQGAVNVDASLVATTYAQQDAYVRVNE